MTDAFFNRVDEGAELARDRFNAHIDLWRQFVNGIRDETQPYGADRLANDFVRMFRVMLEDWSQIYGFWSAAPGASAAAGIPTIGFIVTDDSEAADPKTVAVSFLGPDSDPADVIVTPLVKLGAGGIAIPPGCLTVEFAPGELRVGLQDLRRDVNLLPGEPPGPRFKQGDYLGAVYFNQGGSPKPLASVYVVRI
jgi:hypothetical protein